MSQRHRITNPSASKLRRRSFEADGFVMHRCKLDPYQLSDWLVRHGLAAAGYGYRDGPLVFLPHTVANTGDLEDDENVKQSDLFVKYHFERFDDPNEPEQRGAVVEALISGDMLRGFVQLGRWRAVECRDLSPAFVVHGLVCDYPSDQERTHLITEAEARSKQLRLELEMQLACLPRPLVDTVFAFACDFRWLYVAQPSSAGTT